MTDQSSRPRRSLRLMEIVSGVTVNGAMTHCWLLSQKFAERGHHVTVVCRPNSWVARQRPPAGVRIVTNSLRRLPPRQLRKFARWATAEQFDVLHTHQSSANLYGVLLRWLTGIPSVATAHACHVQPHWMFNDRVIGCCEATLTFHRRFNWVRASRSETIPNFVDSNRFREVDRAAATRLRQKWQIGADEIVISCVGRVTREKGIEDLLAALRLLSPQQRARVRLLLIGELREPYRQRLTTRFGEFDWGRRTMALGERGDVPELLAASDLVVCPSHHECFPMSVLEAMAIGKPVLATRVGGVPECFGEGLAECLVPAKEPAALARALRSLIEHPERRLQLGVLARERVAGHFTADRVVPRLEAVFRQLLRPAREFTAGFRSSWLASQPPLPAPAEASSL